MVRPPRTVVRVPTSMLDGVDAVQLWRVRVPLLEPFAAAHGTIYEREVVLVEVGDGAFSGWGECVALSQPTYTAEHTAGAWQALKHEIIPAVLRGDEVDIGRAPMAWTAIETALLDRRLRRQGASLASHLGATRSTVASTAVVGLQPTIDALLTMVERRVTEGHDAVKLKIEPGRDVDVLGAVRDAWPDLTLAADANGSYTGRADDLAPLAQFGLAYLEQPLGRDELVGHARVRHDLGLRVALDESIESLDDVERALRADALDVINLKPGRVGGIAESARLVAIARDAGIEVFVGGMLETGVGRAMALAFAALESCSLPTDLGPSSRYFAEDIIEPLIVGTEGRLTVPEGPGLGVTPRPDRLEAVAVDRATIAVAG